MQHAISITAGTLTALGIATIDPYHRLLFAFGCGTNVFVLVEILFVQYRERILLSPISGVTIGPGLILCYSWGNVPAVFAGDARLTSQPGTLAYYPDVAVLCAIGLLLFHITALGLLKEISFQSRVSVADMRWRPSQLLAAVFLMLVSVTYLSQRYEFVGGRYREVGGEIDRWLASSFQLFVVLVVVIAVEITIHAKNLWSRLLGSSCLVLALSVAVGLRYRTFMVMLIVVGAATWLTIKPKQLGRVVAIGSATLLIVFALGTVVKKYQSQSRAVADNFAVLGALEATDLVTLNYDSAAVDLEYRLAGFEMPAALAMGLERGGSALWGAGFVAGLTSSLPNFLRPVDALSERATIHQGFFRWGLFYDDSIGVPLSSGLADFGYLLSPLIYVLLAMMCAATWWVAQRSARAYLAFLVSFYGVGDLLWDLVWEDGFLIVKAMVFAYLIFVATGPLLMPTMTHRTASDAEVAPNKSASMPRVTRRLVRA